VKGRDLAAILQEAGIAVAYLFGSRASATQRPDSDADVAVLTQRPLGLLEREALARRLAEALEAPRVDLVVLDDAGLQLRGRVVQ
jgi:predicted nucleotidyltransferase